MSPIETPRTSLDTPSTRILTQFRTSLDKRWSEFDRATLEEAFGAQMVRDNHPDYKATKQAFDEAKEILSIINDDAELKRVLSGPTKLNANIQKIEKYLADLKAPERQKAYNQVLSSTLADISKLKSSLESGIQKSEAVITPVLAKKPETMTESTLSTTATPVDDLLKPLESVAGDMKNIALGAGTAVAATGLISEGGMKKAMAEGFTTFKGWAMSIFEGDGIFAKLFGADMKTKLAGIFDKIGIGLPISSAEAGTLPEELKTHYPNSRYRVTATVFANLIKDSTVVSPYLLNSGFQKLPLSTLEQAYRTKNYTELYKLVPYIEDNQKKKIAIDSILEHIFDKQKITSRVLDSAYRADKKIQKSEKVNYAETTLEQYFSAAGPSMSRIASIPAAIASGGQSIGSSIRVENGKIAGVDESVGELDTYQFSKPELREKYLVTLLGSLEGKTAYFPSTKKDALILSIFESENGAFGSLSQADRDEVQKELMKLLNFADNLNKTLFENATVNLGMGTEIKSIISDKGFSLKGLLIMSHMLGGKTDYEYMSLVEKGMMHSIVTSIFGASGFDSGKLAGIYANKFKSSEAVADVRDFMIDLGKQLGITAAKGTWEGIKWIAGFLKESPDIGGVLIGINLPIFSESTSILGKIGVGN